MKNCPYYLEVIITNIINIKDTKDNNLNSLHEALNLVQAENEIPDDNFDVVDDVSDDSEEHLSNDIGVLDYYNIY